MRRFKSAQIAAKVGDDKLQTRNIDLKQAIGRSTTLVQMHTCSSRSIASNTCTLGSGSLRLEVSTVGSRRVGTATSDRPDFRLTGAAGVACVGWATGAGGATAAVGAKSLTLGGAEGCWIVNDSGTGFGFACASSCSSSRASLNSSSDDEDGSHSRISAIEVMGLLQRLTLGGLQECELRQRWAHDKTLFLGKL
jgi:hypothetical protein